MVVVCMPSPVAPWTSPVRNRSDGSSALASEDFPTPLWPRNTVVCPPRKARTLSRPSPVAADTVKTG